MLQLHVQIARRWPKLLASWGGRGIRALDGGRRLPGDQEEMDRRARVELSLRRRRGNPGDRLRKSLTFRTRLWGAVRITITNAYWPPLQKIPDRSIHTRISQLGDLWLSGSIMERFLWRREQRPRHKQAIRSGRFLRFLALVQSTEIALGADHRQ